MRTKKNLLFCCVILMLFLAGCVSKPQTATDGQKWSDDWTTIGTGVGIEVPEQLTLLDSNEALAADGLYYATWVTGGSVPYENSDKDIIDLYDAQLYLLTNEAVSETKAKSSCETWLATARENYEVHSENTVTFAGQSYTLITYSCINEENPYDRGVSAFGVCGETAICAELACVEHYTEDLEILLTEFLNNCHFRAD